jgi:hypothetical protein
MVGSVTEDSTDMGRAPPPPPVMALRTYASLRLVSVAVIVLLAVAICREVFYGTPNDCLQGSISAYYYTPVQSVFVGTLLALGFVMVVLWGKTTFEDGFLNLAGLLAPVVAFVPTDDTNRCGLTNAVGDQVDTTAQKNKVIAANLPTIINNMTAYLIVVGAVLAILFVVGLVARPAGWESITERPLAYWGPLGLAVALWGFGAFKFWHDRGWIYDHAHAWAANIMFVFIGCVVLNIGYHKWRDKRDQGRGPMPAVPAPFLQRKPGAVAYVTIAAGMVLGFVMFRMLPGMLPQDIADHGTFWLEAWEIFMLAIFWGFQTWDRWNEGAPLAQTRKQTDWAGQSRRDSPCRDGAPRRKSSRNSADLRQGGQLPTSRAIPWPA